MRKDDVTAEIEQYERQNAERAAAEEKANSREGARARVRIGGMEERASSYDERYDGYEAHESHQNYAQPFSQFSQSSQSGNKTSKKKSTNLKVIIFVIIFVVISLTTIFPSLIFALSKNADIQKVANNQTGDSIVLCVIMLFFMLIGLAFIIIPLLLKRRKLNRCSEKLMATCVKLDSHISTDSDGSSTRVYCPTWRFYFGGLEYNVKEKGYSNINVPKKGEERELYVNPENPREIYRKNPFVTAILVIMGAIFFLIGFLTVTFNFVFSFVS